MTPSALVRRIWAAIALLATAATSAQATGIVPLSGSQQFDVASSPPAFLNGGKLYIYQPGTTTPLTVYSDFALTVSYAFPIILDSAGRIPKIYAPDGSVRLRLLNSVDVLQYDEDNIALVTAITAVTPVSVTAQQLWATGDVKVRYDDQPFSGYVRANGRTIGSATSGATERANADTQNLFTFLWPFANISVVAGKGASAAADWAANKQLTLPDLSGRLLGGRDDMGNGAQGRITAATVAGPTAVGASGGVEKSVLVQGNLPAANFTVSGITLNDPGHTHSLTNIAGLLNAGTFTFAGTGALAVTNIGANTGSSPAGVTVATQGTAASGGSGASVNTIAPVMLFTIYLKL